MKKNLKKLIQFLIYPLTIIIALLFAWNSRANGAIPFSALVSILVSVNIMIWILEFILPYRDDWRPDKKMLKLDIIYSLSAAILITPLLKLMIFYFATRWDLSVLHVWPNHWSIIVQLLIAIVFADLFIYLFHRWTHMTNLGWKIHVVHHTPEKLHFWASARTHPINLFIVYTSELGVLVFLGANSEVLGLWMMFMSINGQFQHCNIDIKPGIFNYIFQTCATHRVHHSPNWKNSNSNFGNQTVFWDHIFGTFFLPEKQIEEVGIKMHKIPENYWDQLKAPFILDKFKVK